MQRTIFKATLLLSTAALAGTPAWAQVRIGPPIRIDVGPGKTASNETTQSVSLSNPLVGVSGWQDWRIGDGIQSIFGVTRDGGKTWTEFVIQPPPEYHTIAEGDPMTAYDDRTDTLWAGAIAFGPGGSVYAARLEPGKTAFEPTAIIRNAGSDKGWMAAGRDPNKPKKTRVYCATLHGVYRSIDMGDTWKGPNILGGGAAGFLPRVGPNGELYVAFVHIDGKYLLERSFDGGVHFPGDPITIAIPMDPYWGESRVPGSVVHALFPGMAVDPNDGTLYVVYADTTRWSGSEADVDVYFTKSIDQGATWTTPVVINGDATPFGDQFFPWVEVDEEGRVHVCWYDTRNVRQKDSNIYGLVDAYYAFSEDQGSTWSEFRLTPSPWSSRYDGFDSDDPRPNFIGDYIGMSVGGGRVLPVYMATDPDSQADIYTNVVLHGPAQVVCRGILCPCGNNDPKAGCGNSGFDGNPATGASVSASGSPSVRADDLVLTVSGMKANKIGVLYVGPGPDSSPAGAGRRCIGGGLQHYPVRKADSAGQLQYGPGEIVSLAASFPMGFQPLPGETWYYQVFYLDPQGPCGATFNATEAVSVLWE